METRGEQTVITEDVEVVGTIKAANGLRMDGKLSGDLNCNSDVSIGKTANIKGNLSVNCVTVHGQISGNVAARDRIELKAAARITGDIKAKRLTVEDGVTFVGKVEVNPTGTAGAPPEPVPETDGGDRSPEKRSGMPFLGRK